MSSIKRRLFINFEEKLNCIANAAEEKKSSDIVVLDFRDVEGPIADAFVVCSGASERQVRAICDNICDEMKTKGYRHHHFEGTLLNQWILVDFGDIIVHVFLDEVREHYRLEHLWRKVPQRNLSRHHEFKIH